MHPLLKKIDARELRLALLGAGLVVTSVAITTLLVPKIKAYRATNAEIAILEEAQKDDADLEQHLQDRNARIQELKFRLNGEISDLPFKEIESYVIGRLQNISWRNNVELVSIAPAAGERVQIFRELLFNIELIGEYADIYRWMWDAKNELGFVVVKEYAMTRRDTIDDHPRLLAEVSLASYRAEE